MVFSSVIFICIFLPLTIGVYYILKEKYRNFLLLIVSLLFYSFGGVKYLIVMIGSIVINYTMGLIIDKYKNTIRLKKIFLVLVVLINLSILYFFKYVDFSIDVINLLCSSSIPYKNIVLPIGISFFTFQGLSYVLDVYMNKVSVQKNILNIALYISFFPQLIAGPIVRYNTINNQIVKRESSVDKFYIGIKRFIFGLAKKVIISNQLAVVVDQIFNLEFSYLSTTVAWLGIILYALQIFFDFSGYSDMAIGLGKMFGFEFLENFNYPYISKSITEFWRRWHISLSTWFRDYVYIPLGGNRTGNLYFNLIIVFLLTGLWHGASWNFIIWGMWHGMFLIIERICKTKSWYNKIPVFIRRLYTIIAILIGWVFFRAVDLKYAVNYLCIMFSNTTAINVPTVDWYINNKRMFILILAIIFSIPVINNKYIKKINNTFNKSTVGIIISNTIIMLLFILTMSMILISGYNPFIYFQF